MQSHEAVSDLFIIQIWVCTLLSRDMEVPSNFFRVRFTGEGGDTKTSVASRRDSRPFDGEL